jgi:arylsulfatase A-like enzyme
MRTTILALSLLLLLAQAALPAGPASPAKPNVLIILADDLGYADLGFQGSKEVPTPHLDALAKSGVRCTSGYVTHPFCSPSRAALLTGRYQQRFGHEYNPVYDPLDRTEGLPLNERLLPEFMRKAGYATGWVGKWHLGSWPAHAPWRRGFHETFGFIGGGHRYLNWRPNDRQYTLPITRNGRPVGVKEHLTTAFGNAAAAFVRRHSGGPWLLYLAFNAPHTPHEPTPKREERFRGIEPAPRRKCLAQISLLDDAVGVVLRALDETGQAGRTLGFCLSDNGGPITSAAKNEPLRGTKGQLYEGGVRVPFVVRWPGHLPAGTTYDAPVSSLDIFATAVALADVSVPAGKQYDGVNLIPYLAGKSQASPHDRLFWRTEGGEAHAVREDRWKLIRLKDKPAELFDLAADIGETRNLAAVEPEVANRLAQALDAWDRELIPPLFLGSSAKNEDWGPAGANQRRGPSAVKKPASR